MNLHEELLKWRAKAAELEAELAEAPPALRLQAGRDLATVREHVRRLETVLAQRR